MRLTLFVYKWSFSYEAACRSLAQVRQFTKSSDPVQKGISSLTCVTWYTNTMMTSHTHMKWVVEIKLDYFLFLHWVDSALT